MFFLEDKYLFGGQLLLPTCLEGVKGTSTSRTALSWGSTVPEFDYILTLPNLNPVKQADCLRTKTNKKRVMDVTVLLLAYMGGLNLKRLV